MNYNLIEKSGEIRQKTLDFHRQTKTAHVGSNMSCIEILTTLYYGVMNKGDKFILSKGHASGSLYVVLNDLKMLPDKELYNLEEHPTLKPEWGIDATTGSLGQGLSIGLGMALPNKEKNIYVLMGDGECDEGQIWEAADLASKLKTSNLIGIVDCNGWQGFKETDNTNLGKKFNAFGWEVKECDGHSCDELYNSFQRNSQISPLVIIAKTIKGKGVLSMEDKLGSHYWKL